MYIIDSIDILCYCMRMMKVFTATEARSNFFNLLNRVLYAGETIFIRKAGTDGVVKLESVPDGRMILKSIAGSISVKDANYMKETIRKSRLYRKRSSFSF